MDKNKPVTVLSEHGNESSCSTKLQNIWPPAGLDAFKEGRSSTQVET
jgi:hypothetical protein